MTEVLSLLKSINASILDGGGEGTDIGPWMEGGVPGASLKNEDSKYFYFHHTNGIVLLGWIAHAILYDRLEMAIRLSTFSFKFLVEAKSQHEKGYRLET